MVDVASAGADSAADAAAPARTSCAQCGVSLEWASLLLVCDHHLCLPCAARALQRSSSSGPVVRCRICRGVTNVDELAAQHLEDLRTQTLGPDEAAPSGSTSRGLEASTGSAAAASRSMTSPPQAQSRGRSPSPRSLPNHGTPALASTPAGPGRSTPAVATDSPLQMSSCMSVCGQCEKTLADTFCEQCEESFCRQCAALVHGRGKLLRHRLTLLGPSDAGTTISAYQLGAGEELASGVSNCAGCSTGVMSKPEPTSGVAAVISDFRLSANAVAGPPLVPLPRTFLRCPAHPEDPLQFFCLQCETNCICAECALHGDHRGHDVLNVREAAMQLPGKVADLLTTTQSKSEELAAILEHVQTAHKDVASITTRGRRELRNALSRLQVALQEEETALLAEVDRCSADVAEILVVDDHPSEAAARDCHASLQRHHRSGKATDPVQVLNCFAKAKKAAQDPAPNRPEAGRELSSQLRGQLQCGFEARLAGIQAVAAEVSCLTPVRLQVAESPMRTANGSSPRSEKPPAQTWSGNSPTEDQKLARLPFQPTLRQTNLGHSTGSTLSAWPENGQSGVGSPGYSPGTQSSCTHAASTQDLDMRPGLNSISGRAGQMSLSPRG